MLHDAPGGSFIALDEAPVGSLLPREHVLLVAVQRTDGLWVLRGMRIGAYFSAIKVKATDVVKYGSADAAVLDAQQLAVGIPDGNVATAKPRRVGATETTVTEWVREVERRYLATGGMWATQGDGTEGLGMPQLQYVVGGDFTAASTGWGEGRLASVRLELREIGDELALLTPVGHVPPPSERGQASGTSLALPEGGADPEATPVSALPELTADTSPVQPMLLASLKPP
jgi:hypothetical protein